MFLIALLSGVMALFFVQFGAMSVTVKLLSFALGALILVATVVGVVFLIRMLWPTVKHRARLRRLP